MGQTRNYNAAEVSVIVGTRRLTALAEGTFVSVTRDEDSFTKQVGADGEVTRARTNNRAGAIEITLLQSSPDNEYLQTLNIADELTGQGAVPVTVIDSSGTYKAFCAQAWVRKPADNELGRDAGERTWTLDCGDLDITGGGNLGIQGA